MERVVEASAVIVGSGPNGLACGIALAKAGVKVEIFESSLIAGGGLRTEELTLPGFHHDVFSAVYPMTLASPFFKSLPLHEHGLEWVHSPAVVAHPFDGGTSALFFRSVKETASRLGKDQNTYESFFQDFSNRSEDLMEEIMGPVIHAPKHPFLLSHFGLNALRSAESFSYRFLDERTRGLWAGIAAHAAIPLTSLASSAAGLVLQIAGHAEGWPIPKGGAKSLAAALISYFESLGGVIHTGVKIDLVDQLPKSKFIFFDLTPRQILKIVGSTLKPSTQKRFQEYKYGVGVFKMDWALSGPIPWASKECALAATVHLGGTFQEIKDSEDGPNLGKTSSAPYVLLCQPSLFDSTRAPAGKHTAWAYCHVPNGDITDVSEKIEKQIERFAPGFKKLILKRNILNPSALENLNSNLVGGDISGGLIKGGQLFFRPAFSLTSPYAIEGGKYFICSSSTPPGPGVHGMCGFRAAQTALKL